MTKQILGRQSHTRHASFDLNGNHSLGAINEMTGGRPFNLRKYSHDDPAVSQTPTISENVPYVPGTNKAQIPGVRFRPDDSTHSDDGFSTDDSSIVSSDSFGSYESDVLTATKERVRTAKYVFLNARSSEPEK